MLTQALTTDYLKFGRLNDSSSQRYFSVRGEFTSIGFKQEKLSSSLGMLEEPLVVSKEYIYSSQKNLFYFY